MLFDELDPIGRFTKERLTEDTVGSFLSTEDLVTAYRDFLKTNDL